MNEGEGNLVKTLNEGQYNILDMNHLVRHWYDLPFE